jgi:hypothetical protein
MITMEKKKAQSIGSKQALLFITIGLIISNLIMAIIWSGESFFKSLFWFTEFGANLNIVTGIVLLYGFGYFFGQKTGINILIKNRNQFLMGIKYAFLTLLLSVFLASCVGFFQEGIHHFGKNETPIVDYIVKPLYWVTLFGFIPVILTGACFGYSIKRKQQTNF